MKKRSLQVASIMAAGEPVPPLPPGDAGPSPQAVVRRWTPTVRGPVFDCVTCMRSSTDVTVEKGGTTFATSNSSNARRSNPSFVRPENTPWPSPFASVFDSE